MGTAVRMGTALTTFVGALSLALSLMVVAPPSAEAAHASSCQIFTINKGKTSGFVRLSCDHIQARREHRGRADCAWWPDKYTVWIRKPAVVDTHTCAPGTLRSGILETRVF